MVDKSGASPQAVSLPSGGGDIRGLGETFQPDLNSGTGNYSITLDLLPGVRNFQPSLGLVYSTGAGNSPWGLGWSLPVPAFHRRTFRGTPTYDDARDSFLYNGATELVEVVAQTYRAAVENAFERFVRTDAGWEVTEKSGIRHFFGQTPESRVEFDEDGQTRVFAWLVERSEDTAGNAITYHYRQEGPQRYLEEVRYAIYTVRFEYEARPDLFSEFRSGFELLTVLRCSRIMLHVKPIDPEAVRSWHLEYAEAHLSRLSLLSRVTLSGHDPETSASASLPPLEFSYTGFDPARRRYQRFTSKVGTPPPGVDHANVELVDLEGRGLPGVMAVENGKPRYWPNHGNLRWKPSRSLERFPVAFSLGDDRIRMVDMDGNGAADLLVGNRPFSGYFENHGNGHWEEFVRYSRSPSFDFEHDEISLVDIDGDGLVDAVRSSTTGLHVYQNRGAAGWEAPRLVPKEDPLTGPPDLIPGRSRVRLANMNSDGLLDVVLISSGHIEYWPSRGNGRYGAGRIMANPPDIPRPFDPNRILLTDINGDGLSDVVYVGYDEVTYWINQSGNSFSPAQTIRHTPPTPNPAAMRVVDMKATGTAGLVWTGPFTDFRYLDFTGGVKPCLLNRIDNHLGLIITIGYETSTQQTLADEVDGHRWDSFLPFPVQVVTSVTTDDAVSGLHTVTRYRYHEGHYDGQRREFDGFARAEQIEVGDESIPTAVILFHFHTEASARKLEPDPDFRRTLKRKLYRVEAYGKDGPFDEEPPFHIEETQWSVRVEHASAEGRNVLFPHVTQTSVTTFERGTNERIERRSFTYDEHGNVLTEQHRGDGNGGASLFLETSVEYARNVEDWIVDRPARIVQRDEDGNLLGEIRQYYDGLGFQGLPLGQVTKGLLSRAEKVVLTQQDAVAIYGDDAPDFLSLGYHENTDVDGRPVWFVNDSRRQMDLRGNVVAVRDGRGSTTTYRYDNFDLFVTEVSDLMGVSGTVEHDYRVGKPRRLINPNGGLTEARYDPLGRIVRSVFPGDTMELPTALYTYDMSTVPIALRTEHRVHAGEGRTMQTCEYRDGSGSVYQRRTEYDGNTFVVSGRVVVNARNKPIEKLEPFFDEGADFRPYVDDPALPRRHHFFDALGRPVRTINPDNGQSRAVYGTWQAEFHDQTDTDPSSPFFETPRVEQYDAWQRLVAVEKRSESGSNTTRYSLDLFGRLSQVTDARGVVLTQITYDMLGRKTTIQHLDAGLRLFAYDASGNTVLCIDAEGNSIHRTYDQLNRIHRVTYDGETKEQYFYDDGIGANLRGKLARVSDSSGDTTFSYDSQGQVLERHKTVFEQPEPLIFRYVYDRLGRVTTLTYPDNIAVDFEYYTGLALRRIPGYVEQIEYTAAGVRSSLRYANGARTEYRYDPTTLHLSEIHTARPSTDEVYFHSRYRHSTVGNVESVLDLRPDAPDVNRTQKFQYDALHRLTRAEGFDNSSVYAHNYTYDEVGNFQSNPSIGPHPLVYAGGSATNRLIGFNIGLNEINLFEYDANGNLTTLPGRHLSYNPKHELTRVERDDGTEVQFSYDYRGTLAQRELSGPNGSSRSYFFDNLYEVQDDSTVRWVFAGELPIGRESNDTRVFLHNDHLGSTVVYTDTDGNRLAEAAYYPFGAIAAAPADAEPMFTTKRLDADIGLYYFNARWYAPGMGRFITPDPFYLFQPEQGMQEPVRLNPYAYAGNNPLKFVDPSGLFFGLLIGLAATAIHAAAVGATAAVVFPLAWGGAAIAGMGINALFVGGGGAALGAITHRNDAVGAGRGALLGLFTGLTAGANVLVASRFWGPVVGGALGIINALGVFPAISRSEVYQGFVGWGSYLMPMSWPGHAVGLTLFSMNVVAHLFNAYPDRQDRAHIWNARVDWKTGNILTVGGWVGRLNDTAFNSGAFSFANPDTFEGNIAEPRFQHESGHMLNNGAFGVFHTWTATVTMPWSLQGDANIWFWERMAESNVDENRGRSEIPWWG